MVWCGAVRCGAVRCGAVAPVVSSDGVLQSTACWALRSLCHTITFTCTGELGYVTGRRCSVCQYGSLSDEPDTQTDILCAAGEMTSRLEA